MKSLALALLLGCLCVKAAVAGDLGAAVRHGDLAKLNALIAKGADVNAVSANGDTPLIDAAADGQVAIVRLLIAHGAKVNARDRNGDTPLVVAVREGHFKAAEILIKHGAAVEVKGQRGITPLIWAAKSDQRYLVRLLLARGAHINEPVRHGYTALMAAVREAADPALVRDLIRMGADVNARLPDGGTAWSLAIENHQPAIANLLQEAGALQDYSTLRWSGQYRTDHIALTRVVTDPRSWDDIWNLVFRSTPVPKIDFSKYIVAAVLLGDRPTGGYFIVLRSTLTNQGNLFVTCSVRKRADYVIQVITQPFALQVFPRPAGKVIIRPCATSLPRRAGR